MDAEKFGAFISQCRKEKQMTQAELAARLQVTDKAVSRWERGIGFPDIGTIEPLADALDISVVELMKSEKSVATELSKEEAAQAVSDTLTLAKVRQRQERKHIRTLLGILAVLLLLFLWMDHMQWQLDTILFTGIGVVFPLFCLSGSLVLLGYGIRRKQRGQPFGQTLAAGLGLLFLLILFLRLFFLAGAAGIGPVPA